MRFTRGEMIEKNPHRNPNDRILNFFFFVETIVKFIYLMNRDYCIFH